MNTFVPKICAVADVQGLFVKNKFYVFEFAVKNEFACIHLNFARNFTEENLTAKDWKTARCVQKFVHGLPLVDNSSKFHCEKSENIIRQILQWFLKPGAVVGVKNHHLQQILANLGIKTVDLEKVNCVVEELYNDGCTLHKYGKQRCALNKCGKLWQWVLKRQN